MSNESIGIIAGKGQFPALVARGARAEGLSVVMCGFHGHTDEALEHEADAFAMLHLGQLGKLIDFFRDNNVRRLCLAGAISKPRALDLRPDLRAAKVLFRLRAKGDDAILRAVIDELESEGLAVVQPASLVPGLRAPEGVLTKRPPSDEEWADIRYGWPIAHVLGRLDIGQCIVVKRGMTVAVEGMEGTDATLRRGGELGGEGCVAVKVVKPGQDDRIDLPALGAGTIRVLADYGYTCLALEAGKTLFFDREESIALADKHDISIISMPEGFMAGDEPEVGN
ncbi:LpxI family protein [Desulfovibrio oxamicus]|uniref:LpxI family protein n=1 Tax=Nitratidesulfovibrio oxamicus TaxID=32016 RepID=A0ABS0IZ44_9BACT|nr:UDP-2,3-diacylglucosamine diphosphatase LpxI [Nitratidesulfovibrio oxamicus]MBG3875454.1 LpxI family protein [Nitratidesulfovibrio oxamicus]